MQPGRLDHLRIELASPPGLPYEVTLQFPDGLIVPFPCEDDKTRSVGDYLFHVACRRDAFELVCDINPGYCSPPSLSVELKLPDGTRRSGTLTPEYHRDQPNGPGCEPTCSSGLATLQ